MSRTAAALVIGDEILSGKISEANVAYLARTLFGLGIRLRKVVVCPDEIDAIVGELDALRAAHDHVFTSGGVGPTHDDLTIAAVARAFGRDVVRSPEMERLIRDHFGDRTTDAHLRMADMPAGSRLVRTARVPWPTVQIDNVFVLPGVPEIFRVKLDAIAQILPRGEESFVTAAVYTSCEEWDLAPILRSLVAGHPDVAIGSYPRFDDGDYAVKLTFDGVDRAAVDRAADALVDALPAERIVGRS